MLALARTMVASEGDSGWVESALRAGPVRSRADAGALLMDDGWAVREPPAAVVAAATAVDDSRGDAGEVQRTLLLVGGVHGRGRGQASAPPGRGTDALAVRGGAGPRARWTLPGAAP